jgi:hypothetical protein
MMRVLKCEFWLRSFPLGPFLARIIELETARGKRSVLILPDFRVSLFSIRTIFIWISHILTRIDNDLDNALTFHKKTESADEGIPIDELLPLMNPSMTNIDVISLIIFLNILMDHVARFLKFLFRSESTPKTKSFYDLKKSLKDFKSPRLLELNKIIQDTDWFQNLKNLRDHPIIHRGEKHSQIGIHKERIGIHLRYVENRMVKNVFLSNLEIDKICKNIYHFLEDLNEYLCTNFDYLPLEVVKKWTKEE